MTELPQKLDLRSQDIAEDKRQELLRLFPEIRTEGNKLDFDRLKLALGEAVDVGKERYGMNWPGKADCFKAIQTPSLATVLPGPEESVNFDDTENLVIEGDNLEVLKLLQKSYLGKIKMIYIDPPYNTGSDFIYPDEYAESLQTYLEYSGQADPAGKKFSTNTETDGRFHSKWLNMMYPRIYLARNLLRDDGLILISIDDHELKALRFLMDDIFGEENFVDNIVWKKRYGGGAKEKHLVTLHEYVLVYARTKDSIADIYVPLTPELIERYYKNKDDNFERRGPFRTHPLESMKSFGERANLRFPIKAPDGTMVMPKRQWRWSPSRVEQATKDGELYFSKDKKGSWVIGSKQYLRDDEGQRETKFFSVIDDVYTQHGTNEIVEIFGDAQVFGFPKPSKLVVKLLQFATTQDGGDLVLDFFAGSGTTAHAVLDINKQDGGNRKFILVQLPEPLDPNDKNQKAAADFCDSIGKPRNLSEITKERVRRVIKKLNDGDAGKLELKGKQDRGFRDFKLAESNLKPWDAALPQTAPALERQLELHVNHIRGGRTNRDILFEVLLKSGYPLTTPVETVIIAGKTVHSVAGGQLLICLERKLTLELVRAMAERNPERVVCLDEGFEGNDQLKTNAAHIFEPTDRREAKSDARRFRTV
jgi:adenine-specific DNA-methyltransferase